MHLSFRNNQRLFIALLTTSILSFFGCSKLSNSGLDQLELSGCSAAECHVSTQLMSYPPESGKHVSHLRSGMRITCNDCHSGYDSNPLHKNGVINGYNAILKKQAGGNIIFFRRGRNPMASWDHASGNCSGMGCHGNANWYSDSEASCTLCHSPGSDIDPLIINASGTSGKHARHVTDYHIPCRKCHAGYKTSGSHANGIMDAIDPGVILARFDATNPSGEWTGDTGPQSGSCASLICHGNDSLQWYGTDTWELPDCSTCHRQGIGARRQIVDSNGDGTGTGGDFNRESHHVIDYCDRADQVVTSDDCEVCHDVTGHMGGTVRLKDKDNAGQVYDYDPSEPATLEPFCLSCHDSDGAATESGNEYMPFGSGNELGQVPNSAGSTIDINWDKLYGHRRDGLTCMGSGDPGTGCHGSNGQINAHGSVSRGLLSRAMNFQIDALDDYNEDDYDLCFSCHAAYPGKTKESILGVMEGGNYDYNYGVNGPMRANISYGYPPYYIDEISTGFIDTDGHMHDSGSPKHFQLHWFHLSMRFFQTMSGEDTDAWLYRGEGTVRECTGCHLAHGSTPPLGGKKATCTACHSVHGSGTPFGMVYDEFNMTHNAGETAGHMGIERTALTGGPFFCSMSSCHCSYNGSGTDHRYYQFYPADE